MPSQADLLFGQIALRKGLIDQATLDSIIAEQTELEADGIIAPIGKILLGRRLLNPEQVEAVAVEQNFLDLRDEDKRLGVLAVRNRLCTEDQVKKALAAQKQEFRDTGRIPARIGIQLLQLGFLQPQQVGALVKLQQRLQARRESAGEKGGSGRHEAPPGAASTSSRAPRPVAASPAGSSPRGPVVAAGPPISGPAPPSAGPVPAHSGPRGVRSATAAPASAAGAEKRSSGVSARPSSARTSSGVAPKPPPGRSSGTARPAAPAAAPRPPAANVPPAATPADACQLVEIEGSTPGRVIPLHQDLVLGRSDKEADYALDDKKLSRRHARFEPTPAGWRLSDLDSRNGTLRNGQKIEAPVILQPGDRISIGYHLFRFDAVEAEAVGEAAPTVPMPADFLSDDAGGGVDATVPLPAESAAVAPTSPVENPLDSAGDIQVPDQPVGPPPPADLSPHVEPASAVAEAETSSGAASWIVLIVLILGVLGGAAYVFKEPLLALLPAGDSSKGEDALVPFEPPKTPQNAPPTAAQIRKKIKADLDAIYEALRSPTADVAALRKKFDDLRREHDPRGTDGDFEAIAQTFAGRAANQALAAWEKLRNDTFTLRRENRFAEALDRLTAYEPHESAAEMVNKQRGELIDATLNDAERYRVSLTKMTREQVASGKRDSAFAHIKEARIALPEQFHTQLDELEKQLRAYADRLDGKEPAKDDGSDAGSGASEPVAKAPGSDASGSTSGGGERPAGHPEAAERRRAEGQARLEAARRRLEDRRRAREVERKEMAARAAARTARVPIDVQISEDFRLTGCQVLSCDAEGAVLQSAQATFPISWSALPARTAYDIRRLAIDEGSAEAHLALGKYCLLRDLFDQAEREFRLALELDPALASRIPDVQLFRNRSRIFRGSWTQIGRDVLRISYDFNQAEEAEDFRTGGRVAVSKGGLDVTGTGVYFANVKDVDFEDFVTLEVQGVSGVGGSPTAGLIFHDKAGAQSGVLVVVDPRGTEFAVLRVVGSQLVTVLQPQKMPKDSVLQVKMASLKLEVRIRGKRVWSAAQSAFSGCWVVVGGIADKLAASTRFNRLKVEGKAGAEWIRKSLSTRDTLALRELEDDLRGLDTGAGAVARTPSAWTIEDGLPALPAAARDRYLWVKGNLQRGDLERPNELMKALADAEAAAPDFAGTFLLRAMMLARLGLAGQAGPELARVLELRPDCYEALEFRASLLIDGSRYPDAERDAKAALALAPDLARAYLHLGRVAFSDGRRDEAAGLLELANALDPADTDIRAVGKGVRNVLRGPLWKQTYRAETDHFVVRTDVNPARAQFYAQHLEAIAGFYAQTFEFPLPARKADALIFETQEGYQTYAELTLEDRVESTLGYYHPIYDQLLLFEDKTEGAGQETLRVVYHEGFHQFIHNLVPHMPYWLNEGLAEYFGASEVKDGRVARTGLVQEGRLLGLQSYLGQGGRPIPFDRIMLETPGEFYSGNVPLKYAQAWSMVHFFMEDGAKVYRHVLKSYLEALRGGASAGDAFAATFGRLDLKIAERDWLNAVRRMKAE